LQIQLAEVFVRFRFEETKSTLYKNVSNKIFVSMSDAGIRTEKPLYQLCNFTMLYLINWATTAIIILIKETGFKECKRMAEVCNLFMIDCLLLGKILVSFAHGALKRAKPQSTYIAGIR